MSLMQSFGVSPNQPQVIDPRAAYEQQAMMADQMLQRSQQYTGGGLGEALAMMLNAYGAKKYGEQAQGSLSEVLQQEAMKEQQAAKAAARAEQEAREQEFNNWLRKQQWKRENPEATAFEREAAFAGVEPGSPEARARFSGAGRGPTVNVNSGPQGPQVGTIPQDFELITDPETGRSRLEVIPGSDTDIERRRAAEAEVSREGQDQISSNILLDEIGIARDVIEKNPGIATGNIGLLGAMFNMGPGQTLQGALDTIKPIIGFDYLANMRQSSPTGAGVGNLTEKEFENLAGVYGSLKQEGSDQDLTYRLSRLHNLTVDAVHGTREQRAAAVRRGDITPELSAQVDAMYVPDVESMRPGSGNQPQSAPRQGQQQSGGFQLSPEAQRIMDRL